MPAPSLGRVAEAEDYAETVIHSSGNANAPDPLWLERAGDAAVLRGDLRSADAVCVVLGLRFYKRIAAHMANIATCVVMPVDKMDFYDE